MKFNLWFLLNNRSCSARGGQRQSCWESRNEGWGDLTWSQWRVSGVTEAWRHCGQSETEWKAGLLHSHHSLRAGLLHQGEQHSLHRMHFSWSHSIFSQSLFCCSIFYLSFLFLYSLKVVLNKWSLSEVSGFLFIFYLFYSVFHIIFEHWLLFYSF